jgi:hypothetical protein
MWLFVFSYLSATAMAASSVMLIVCRSSCDLMSMCVMVFVLGFTTPAPNVGFSLTYGPSVYIKSRGSHLLLCCVVWSIVWLGRRGWVGAGVLVYDLQLSMFIASGRVVSILCVSVLCPYSWVMDVFSVL